MSRLAPLTRRKLRRTGAAGVSEDRTALFSDVGDKQVMVGVQNTLSCECPPPPPPPIVGNLGYLIPLDYETCSFLQR